MEAGPADEHLDRSGQGGAQVTILGVWALTESRREYLQNEPDGPAADAAEEEEASQIPVLPSRLEDGGPRGLRACKEEELRAPEEGHGGGTDDADPSSSYLGYASRAS